MEQQAFYIATSITIAFLFVCSLLEPPKKECTIRDTQGQIAMALLMMVCLYRLLSN